MHIPCGDGGGVSDNFFAVAKVKGKLGFTKRKEQVQCRVVIKFSELGKRVHEQEYGNKLRLAYEMI